MMIRTAISAIVAGAALVGAAAPTIASAQAYGYDQGGYQGGQGGAYDRNGYYYDPCRRSTTNRATGGGLAGAGIGAAIGSSVAARGAKTEGAVLGGLLGAVVGGNIGKSSAACAPGATPPPPPPPPRAYNDRYDDYDRNAGGYDDAQYDRRGGYTYESERSYRVTEGRADANGCTLAESPIYLPDGRTQKRFVRVCPDASGRYQVVD